MTPKESINAADLKARMVSDGHVNITKSIINLYLSMMAKSDLLVTTDGVNFMLSEETDSMS